MSCADYTGDIYIEITDNCNLHCLHCYNKSLNKKKNRYISKDEFQSFLLKAKEIGINSISISGGEPFLHPLLSEFICMCSDLGIESRIVTNGTLITDLFLNKIIGTKTLFQVSIDGSSFEKHEQLTCTKGSYNNTIHSLNLLNRYHFPFVIKTIITKANKDDLEELVSLAIQKKAKGISFSFLQIYGRAIDNRENIGVCSNELIQLYLNTLLPLFNKYPGFVSGPKIQNTRCPLICAHKTEDRRYLVAPRIDSFGNVYPCAMFVSPKFSVGNIFKQSFNDIFSSEEFIQLIDYLCLREKYVEQCNTCIVSNYCGRGCPASSLELDQLNPNYYCQMVKWKMLSDSVKTNYGVTQDEKENK